MFAHGFIQVMRLITIAFVAAWLMNLTVKCWKGMFGFWAVVLNFMILVDYFCIIHFNKSVSQDVVDILIETNPRESKEFLATYLTFGTIIKTLVGLGAVNAIAYLIYWLSKFGYRNKYYLWVVGLLSFAGLVSWGDMCYSYVRFRNGKSIPQYHPMTRWPYMYHVSMQAAVEAERLADMFPRIEATVEGEKPSVVVIVGESFSRGHCQLYGYDKPTTPGLQQLADRGELAIFTDVVTVSDHTHGCMHALFGMGEAYTPIGEKPTFPMLFKRAGYHTENWENQYFTDGGVSFMSSPKLSELVWDFRTTSQVPYDYDMTSRIEPHDSTFYVVHLMGQHYQYADRYPSDWAHFSASDYTQYPSSRTAKMAEYDNATLYNDFVVTSLIEKFRDKDCVVVYLPDHGQVVGETDDYFGHGNAQIPQYFNRQVEIPMVVWMSSTYSQKRADLAARVRESVSKPASQADLAHMIVELGGIETASFDPSRSVINASYKPKPRILINTINYDAATPQKSESH